MADKPEPRFTLQFDAAQIPALARRYGPQLDDEALAAGARIRSGIGGRQELVEIFEWKTKGRGRSRLAANTDAEIEDALRLAASASSERAAVAVLVGLSGVDVPAASAILTAIDPGRYTVMDYRALEGLGSTTKDRSVRSYLTYLAECRRLAKEHHVSFRDLDRAL